MKYTPHQYSKTLFVLVKDSSPAKRRETIRNFIGVVAKNNALSLLPEIVREFGRLMDAEEKIRDVTVRSSERIQTSRVVRELPFKARFKSVVDVRLLGGVSIEIDGLRIDNSIASRLERARMALTR